MSAQNDVHRLRWEKWVQTWPWGSPHLRLSKILGREAPEKSTRNFQARSAWEIIKCQVRSAWKIINKLSGAKRLRNRINCQARSAWEHCLRNGKDLSGAKRLKTREKWSDVPTSKRWSPESWCDFVLLHLGVFLELRIWKVFRRNKKFSGENKNWSGGIDERPGF